MKTVAGRVLTVLMLTCWLVPARGEILPKGGRDLLPQPVMDQMQAYMLNERFDGWLFTGQGAFDDLATEFLGLRGATSQRWFIFYPALMSVRKPYLIYHSDDERVFEGINFHPLAYRSRDEMLHYFAFEIDQMARVICLNHSPGLNIPSISRVDGGTIEMLENLNFKLLSSGSILSFFNTRWLVSDIETHRTAASRLDSLLPVIVSRLRERMGKNKRIRDYELADYIKDRLEDLDLEEIEEPVVAFGIKTLEKHHIPYKKIGMELIPGDVIYIEVAARERDNEQAMFSRLGWTLYAGSEVPDSLSRDWTKIVSAGKAALTILENRISAKSDLKGYEVDKAARMKLGGGRHILPRPVGYNLNREQKEFGVRFDNYLSVDDRLIMPGMGFTLEPGIYKDSLALRTCTNLFIDGERNVVLSAPLQEKIITVLAPPPETSLTSPAE